MKRSELWSWFRRSPDSRYGLLLVSIFFIWSVCWQVYLVLRKLFGEGAAQEETMLSMNFSRELWPPGMGGYFLGTDLYGRSLFEMISMGLSYSIGLSLTVSMLAMVIGIFMGTMSVFSPKYIRIFFRKSIHIFFTLPGLLLAIALMSFFGHTFGVLVCSLVLTNWASHAKIVRGELKRLLPLPYVEGAKALGISSWRLFIIHLFPFLLPQLSIHFVLGLSGIIISESTLSFLGLTVNRYSWGYLLGMGKNVLLEAPHITVVMSVVMMMLIIGLNLLGDSLRDYMDPQVRKNKQT
jgi:peptide/nickel transport system permease protein